MLGKSNDIHKGGAHTSGVHRSGDRRSSGTDTDVRERAERSPRVAARHEATRVEILAAAWELARRNGLAGLTVRDLAAAVGMKAPSLYSYFPSKHAVYDAMFREGYEQFVATVRRGPYAELDEAQAEASALEGVLTFFDFCTSEPVRYQLLFQRVLPDFEPSPESMAVALEAYHLTVGQLAEAGITDQAGLDLWTATVTGLVDQQLSNDPGGDRWRALVPRAVRMLLAELTRENRR